MACAHAVAVTGARRTDPLRRPGPGDRIIRNTGKDPAVPELMFAPPAWEALLSGGLFDDQPIEFASGPSLSWPARYDASSIASADSLPKGSGRSWR